MYGPVLQEMAAGTPHDLICGTCPWDRLCIQPPQMTRAEVDNNIATAKEHAARDGATGRDLAAVTLTAIAMFGGRDVMGTMCPVFVARLQSPDGRQLSDHVRATMRGEQR